MWIFGGIGRPDASTPCHHVSWTDISTFCLSQKSPTIGRSSRWKWNLAIEKLEKWFRDTTIAATKKLNTCVFSPNKNGPVFYISQIGLHQLVQWETGVDSRRDQVVDLMVLLNDSPGAPFSDGFVGPLDLRIPLVFWQACKPKICLSLTNG